VDGDGPVSEEGASTREGGGVVINVVCVVVVANDGGIDRTVLSREVTHLASLGEFGVTARGLAKHTLETFTLISCESSYLATFIWVKMAQSVGAVAVSGDGDSMNVVHW
jgi:hypothetical protein